MSTTKKLKKSIILLMGIAGRKTIKIANHLLDLFAFSARLFFLLIRFPKEGRAVVKRGIIEQIYFTAVQALPIIIPVALISGCALIFMFATFSEQYNLGKVLICLIIRELGPFLTAVIVILRSATAVTVEIGYMKVFNEIEALEMAGMNPIQVLFIPRLVGLTSAIFCLFVVFDIICIIGGFFVILLVTKLPVLNLFSQIGSAVTITDVSVGIIKALLFGLIITVVCLYRGFKTGSKITNIPATVSRASVECFFNCLVVNIFISFIFYL